MKFKRIFMLAPMLLGCLALGSCDKEVELEYTDPETGEVTSMTVAETKDSKEVAKVLNAMSQVQADELEMPNGLTINITSDIDLEYTEEGSEEASIMQLELDSKFMVETPEIDIENIDYEAILTDTNVYASIDLALNMPGYDYDLETGSIVMVQNEQNISVEANSDSENYYINFKELEYSGMDLSDQKWKLAKSDVLSMVGEDLNSYMEEILGDYNFNFGDTEQMPTLDQMLEESGMTLEEVCELLNLTITSAKNDEIKFKMTLSESLFAEEANADEESLSFDIEFGINTKYYYPTFVSADLKDFIQASMDAEEAEGSVKDFNFEIKFSAKADIPAVKDKDKYSAITSDMLSGLM